MVTLAIGSSSSALLLLARAIERPAVPSDEAIAAAADAVASSERPLVYLGGGVAMAGATALARELARRLRCPAHLSDMFVPVRIARRPKVVAAGARRPAGICDA